ncbi:mechanosensitive ion channel family protein [Qingshengfaniella alkalisoli]|uniref:Mechanosensitive ion channel n=1 Tax=Qingshengfaniella alkalisoli TaxID=2599296 RepID=A0A5B8I5J4_9RHOB|nr:mechanosensitive ion channel domain-containing protein [Qingshengfaniella alkalisoli]QDY68619.1 mechanosensitive ion channel [Qingshengfaniella alkalisoli]
MEPDAESTLEVATETAQTLLQRAEGLIYSLMQPWSAYQIAIILGTLVVAQVLKLWLAPRFHNWIRDREGWPRWRFRVAILIHQRLRGLIFTVLIWAAVLIMREVTWPSRSYFIAIVANLALAWMFVAFASRLIANRALRRVVSYGAWIWMTLRILNLDREAEAVLDSAALHFGETRISIWLVLQGLVIIGVMFAVARFLSRYSSERIQANRDMSPSMRVLVVKFVQILLFGATVFLGLRAVGVDLTGLAVLSGAIGVGLGFGLQKVVSNLVSGVIILLDKSIKPGDVISLGDTFGWINSLSARYVSVVTRDGREYLIPNEDLITGQVVNWSHSDEFVRLDINFGTGYNDDPHLVRKVAIEAAQSVDRVLKHRRAVCHIVGFGDSSVDYLLRFWIRDPTVGLTNVRGNVYLALWDAFQEHGISIPFPQREVRVLEGSELTAKFDRLGHESS